MSNQPPAETPKQPEQSENTKSIIQKDSSIFNLLAFVPITGIFGFHDLYVKDYKKFASHIIIGIIATILYYVVPRIVADHLFSTSTKGYITMPSDPFYMFFCNALPIFIFVCLYVYAIIENRRFVKAHKMIKVSEKLNNFNDKTLKIAAFLAFFPLTGVFGIHDIIIKRYGGFIIRVVAALIFVVTITSLGLIWSPTGTPATSSPIIQAMGTAGLFIGPTLYPIIIISYLAAFGEGIEIVKALKATPKLPQEPSNT